MEAEYKFIDFNATGPEAVKIAFSNQAIACIHLGAPITARIVGALTVLLERGEGGAVMAAVGGWSGPPVADALALRLAGGLHALHLANRDAALSALYRGEEVADDAAIVAAALRRHEAELLPWLDGPPQTNEAGRSSAFIAAMLWLAGQGLPPRFQCLEIGSSAGINLMLARYRYDLAGVHAGPEPGAMTFAPEWNGKPPPDRAIEIVSTRGCDVAPINLADPAQALKVKAYIWADQTERFARMEAAVAEAAKDPPDLILMNAADFVEAELAKPQQAETARVLMHSIVMQYVSDDQRTRVTAAMAAAGAKATPERPLAWIAFETPRRVHMPELVVRYWPGGGEPRLLARSHPHGASIEWLGGE